jgi:hypothetical protein
MGASAPTSTGDLASNAQGFVNSQGGTFDNAFQVPAGAAASDVAGTAGSGLLSSLGTTAAGTAGASGLSSLIGPAVGVIGQSVAANKIANAATTASNNMMTQTNALDQPQRQQYQTDLTNLVNNPSQFWNTSPVAQGQLNLANQQFQANSAKMGTGGTTFSNYLNNVTSTANSTYNQQFSNLAGAAGFNQAPTSGAAAAGLTNTALGAQNSSNLGIGNLVSNAANTLFPTSSNAPAGTNTQVPGANPQSNNAGLGGATYFG